MVQNRNTIQFHGSTGYLTIYCIKTQIRTRSIPCYTFCLHNPGFQPPTLVPLPSARPEAALGAKRKVARVPVDLLQAIAEPPTQRDGTAPIGLARGLHALTADNLSRFIDSHDFHIDGALSKGRSPRTRLRSMPCIQPLARSVPAMRLQWRRCAKLGIASFSSTARSSKDAHFLPKRSARRYSCLAQGRRA